MAKPFSTIHGALTAEQAQQRDGQGDTLLMDAARNGRLDSLLHLLPLSDPLAANNDGHTALTLAAEEGCLECVRVLLPVSNPNAIAHGAHLPSANALVLAANQGHLSVVLALAPVSKNAWGALQAAARNKNWDCCDALAQWAVDRNDPDDLDCLAGVVALTFPGTLPQAEAMLAAQEIANSIQDAKAQRDAALTANGEPGSPATPAERKPRSL